MADQPSVYQWAVGLSARGAIAVPTPAARKGPGRPRTLQPPLLPARTRQPSPELEEAAEPQVVVQAALGTGHNKGYCGHQAGVSANLPALLAACTLAEDRRKMLQFVAMADTMINGRPMTEYESEHAMFLMLQKLRSFQRERSPLFTAVSGLPLRLFFSNTFDVLTFPYAEALQAWKEAVDRGRYNKSFT
ncbi:hypothetical protein FOA52_013771 [Chlamydomonas sp. UWO 241]|nr:hypothetical protein FOA52_013771 [Chlamydomonas sp. UWO 241]